MATEKLSGQVIGNYTLQEELGNGAFAHVFKAYDQQNDKYVAIKLLDEKHLNSQGERDLRKESEILEQLLLFRCPYILSFIEQGEWSGIPYIVIQLLQEKTLRARLKGEPFETKQAVTVITQIGVAVSTIHQQRIVHSDIRPENILFNEKDEAILTDFGIAVRLPPGCDVGPPEMPPRGTPLYMAPEQFEGIITRQGDQYSLGCIAYELFTGTHPVMPITSLSINNMRKMEEQHRTQLPENPLSINNRLDDFIGEATLKALAKAPEERHEDIITFVKVLSQPHDFSVTTGSYTKQVQTKSSVEISTDLHLPENYFRAFLSLLEWAGFKAKPDESVKTPKNRRWCTRVWEESFESPESPTRALIYIPEMILINPSETNRASIGYICSAFYKDSILVIVSKLSKSADFEILRIIEEDWQKQGVKGIILPWNYIDELIRLGADIRGKNKESYEKDVIKKEIKRLFDWSNIPNVPADPR